MESEIKQNNPSEITIQPEEKPKRGRFFFFVFIVLSTIVISSACGAVFGFLASTSATEIIKSLKLEKLEKLIKSEDNLQSVEQKKSEVQEDSAIIDTVKKASPAVASIVISKDMPKVQNSPDFFGFNFFGQNDNFTGNGATEKQTIGGGTGFFITTDGMIITNKHVVSETSADYTVVTNDNKEYAAKVLARDPINDIAILKVEGENFPTLNLGDSDAMQIGQTVIAIGNSLGEFSNTVSRGIISGLKRNITAGDNAGQSEKLTDILQTDAAINSGNSGGPLLDINGEVIGINVAIAQSAQNIGFAIPSNQIKKVVEQVKTTGKISTPYIGVRYIVINDQLQKENNLPYNYGNLILRGSKLTDFAVIPGSPADKAGLAENDIILEVEGQKIDETEGFTLSNSIAKYNVGDTLTLKIWHKGEVKDVKVKLEEKK